MWAKSSAAVSSPAAAPATLPGQAAVTSVRAGWAVAQGDALEALAELGVAGGGLGEGEFVGGGLEVVAEEDGAVAVA
jgi:hypothetical protein